MFASQKMSLEVKRVQQNIIKKFSALKPGHLLTPWSHTNHLTRSKKPGVNKLTTHPRMYDRNMTIISPKYDQNGP